MRSPLPLITLALLVAARSAAGQVVTPQSAASAPDVAPVTSDILGYQLTTSSGAALRHFLEGQQYLDLEHGDDAHAHFLAALTADSTFALAHLRAAQTSNSSAEYRGHLEAAERNAGHASEGEALLIRMERQGLGGNREAELQLATQLVQRQPGSARALLEQAAVLTNMNRTAEARDAITRALGLSPRLVIAHIQMGISLEFAEPRDANAALRHFQHAVALAPGDMTPHDYTGDAYRALGNLAEARAAYTRAHQLAPTEALELSQRGHVNTFAGDYAAARADYDSAIALSQPDARAAHAQFRALVSVYAGDPRAAITELQRLAAGVDGMGLADPRGARINALTAIAGIAIHTGAFGTADSALRDRATLIRQNADVIADSGFRRNQELGIAYWECWLAARRGDNAAAQRSLARVTELAQGRANPRAMEPVHELTGLMALYRRRYDEAATHLAQGNIANPYVKYQLALAHEGAGHRDEARRLFADVANNNFNSWTEALVRAEAQRKAT